MKFARKIAKIMYAMNNNSCQDKNGILDCLCKVMSASKRLSPSPKDGLIRACFIAASNFLVSRSLTQYSINSVAD